MGARGVNEKGVGCLFPNLFRYPTIVCVTVARLY